MEGFRPSDGDMALGEEQGGQGESPSPQVEESNEAINCLKQII